MKAWNNAWSHMAAKAQPAKSTLAATSPMQPLYKILSLPACKCQWNLLPLLWHVSLLRMTTAKVAGCHLARRKYAYLRTCGGVGKLHTTAELPEMPPVVVWCNG